MNLMVVKNNVGLSIEYMFTEDESWIQYCGSIINLNTENIALLAKNKELYDKIYSAEGVSLLAWTVWGIKDPVPVPIKYVDLIVQISKLP